ncbi:unnamed protein product [Anisakis simplex]|uniref:Solute carrier family 35 member F6 (inferred by orthology to a human protein) n=1 Tax=Anisakis simplex TaxID=6269 RepID=A0A0M3KC12_ANISI|nr:unnamed protein product [Anisakis simplex]
MPREDDVANTNIGSTSAPALDDEEGSKSPSADATQVSIMEDGKGSSLDEEQDVEANKTRANAPVMTAVDEPPNKIFLTSLAVVFIIAGSLNTIAAKWADTTPIHWFQDCYDGHCYHYINHAEYFIHPFFQADVMFVGEVCCMLAYLVSLMIQRYRWRRRRANHVCTAGCEVCNSECPTIPRFNWFLFAIPAFFDVVATSMQYIGLLVTSVVSYQMLRG